MVTGGSRGIGEAISLSFAANGDVVVVNYISNSGRAKGLVTNIREKGGEAHAICADVAKSDDVNRMIDETVEKYGRLDVLVNNAGILKGGLLMLLDEKDWDAVIESNLKGVYNCSKAAVRQMISQRSGAIINVSSMSGITGLAGETNYSAAKGGVIAFTKAAAKELAPFGIRVNAVAPGVIATEMINDMPEDVKKRFLDMIPLKRFGTAAEVAGVVRFLASSEASYITGETIAISGGIP